MHNRFGAYLKELRLAKRLSLREFCLTNGIDPGNYSRLERGQFPPPQSSETLTRYAEALGLESGSDEWLTLFDLAAAERGQIPADLMTDDEVVEKLPILFRTMRATKVAGDDLDGLVEKIRRS